MLMRAEVRTFSFYFHNNHLVFLLGMYKTEKNQLKTVRMEVTVENVVGIENKVDAAWLLIEL